MRKTQLRLTTLAAATAIAVGLSPSPASASQASHGSSTEGDVVSQPMQVLGYDADVAAANGFEILVDADGNETSVPVTPEAVEAQAQADQALADDLAEAGGIQARSEVNMGTCGKVWLTASKGANDMLTATVGFKTYMNGSKFNWTIVAPGVISGWVQTWNGGATTPAGWSASNTAKAIGPGVAALRLSQYDGYVVLVNGTKCQPGLPGPLAGFS